MNIKFIQGANKKENIKPEPVQQDNSAKANKKLILALAGLAVAGGVIALGILKHKGGAKEAQFVLQNADKLSTSTQNAANTANKTTSSSSASQNVSSRVSSNATSASSSKNKGSAGASSGSNNTSSRINKRNANNNDAPINIDKGKGKEQIDTNKPSEAVSKLTGEELFIQNRKKIIDKYYPDAGDFYINRPLTLYSDLRCDFYKDVRYSSVLYEKSAASVDNIAAITAKSNNNINVLSQNGWHYRQPKKLLNDKTVGRVSLNVYPEADLINKLDNLVGKSDGIIEYKVPDNASEWCKRHDPITIYFKPSSKDTTQKIIDEIVDIASPHIRKADDASMLGLKLADGVFRLPEPNKRHVNSIIDRAKTLGFDDNFIEFLEKDDYQFGAHLYSTHSNGQKYVHTSPGNIEALNRMLDEFEKILS